MAGFSLFNPIPNGFVEPVPNFRAIPGSPLPTNSWAQNAVKGTVITDKLFTGTWPTFSPETRNTKPLPWFVSPYYGDGVFGANPFILLGHSSVNEVTHSTEFGNNDVSIAAQGFIDRLTVNGKNQPMERLFLTNLDDGSATYSFENSGDDDQVSFHTSRGSPFINLIFPAAASINLLFTSIANIPGVPQVISDGNFYRSIIPFTYRHTTTSVTTYFTGSVIYPIYNRYEDIGTTELKAFTFDGTVPLSGQVYSDGVLVGTFINGTFTATVGAIWNSDNNSLTIGNRVVFIFPTLSRTTNTTTLEHTINFLSRQSFTIQKVGGSLTITSTDIGNMWIYCDDTYPYHQDTNLGYIGSMVAVENGSEGKYNLNITVSSISVYAYTPRWWQENYNISGVRYLTNTIYDIAYGDCTLTNITSVDTTNSNLTVVATSNGSGSPPSLVATTPYSLEFTPKITLILPTSPYVPQGLNFEPFKKRIINDTKYYKNFNVPLDPTSTNNAYAQQSCYVFAQNAAKYGRILVFANLTGVLTAEMSSTYITLLSSWLNGTNSASQSNKPDSNQLRFETRWGGVITLADYYVKIYPNQQIQGNFNNSFYNDHHFQYGYFFSALYALFLIKQKGTLITYAAQIKQLLQDVVTSYGDLSSKCIKTRHKDWFFGHSFATGLLQSSNIDQESVSEAINCYYSAWLLSGAMYILTGDISFKNMRNISEAALYTEIHTAKLFWTANGKNIGVQSATIIKAFTKTYAAYAGGQPPSYPSNSLYRYSIISLPFTDITPVFLDKDWVERFATVVGSNYQWQRVNKSLISGLTNYEQANTNAWSYTPTPSPYDENRSKFPEGITGWGFVGLQLLALGNINDNVLTSDEALRYYNKVEDKVYDLAEPLNEDVIKRFDSLSNAYYVLYYLAKFNSITPVVANNDSLENLLQNSKSAFQLFVTPQTNIEVTKLALSSDGLYKCPRLVEVPTIEILAIPNSTMHDVEKVIFTVRDVIDYSKPRKYCEKWNFNTIGMVPEDEVITTTFTLLAPECNFNSVLNGEGNSLLEICRNMNAIVPYIIQYTYTKWILCRLLYGSFDLKFLRRDFNAKFFKRLSKFCKFMRYFTSSSLVDYNGLLYNVIGHGSTPHQGIYYFIP